MCFGTSSILGSPHHCDNQECWLDKFCSSWISWISRWNLNMHNWTHNPHCYEWYGSMLVPLQKVMENYILILIAFSGCWPVFSLKPNPQGHIPQFYPIPIPRPMSATSPSSLNGAGSCGTYTGWGIQDLSSRPSHKDWAPLVFDLSIPEKTFWLTTLSSFSLVMTPSLERAY